MNLEIDNDNEEVTLVGDKSFFELIKRNNAYQFVSDTIKNARWIYHASHVWADGLTKYMGIETMKFPTDMWIMQELIYEIKPDVLIETGTWKGGSALYFAHLMDALGCGRVITVDNDSKPDLPKHDRIKYIVGDCLSNEVIETIASEQIIGPVLVNLDSAHKKDHVLKEMNLYCQFVTDNSYMVVEDGILGHPIIMKDDRGNSMLPGPYEAINEFVKLHPDFISDRTKEKFQVTSNIKGYLKRTGHA